MNREHVLSIMVKNTPGVLTKIAGMFYRRGHNIKTLTVGKMHIPGLSKLIISLPMDDADVELLRRQIENLVDVKHALLLNVNQSIMIETCLVRIECESPDLRDEIMQASNPYRPRICGVDGHSIVLEIAETMDMIDDFVATMSRFNIIDVSRTGMTALGPNPALLEAIHAKKTAY